MSSGGSSSDMEFSGSWKVTPRCQNLQLILKRASNLHGALLGMQLVDSTILDWQSIQNDINFIICKSQHLSIFWESVNIFFSGQRVSSILLTPAYYNQYLPPLPGRIVPHGPCTSPTFSISHLVVHVILKTHTKRKFPKICISFLFLIGGFQHSTFVI